jgi:hypothetical protein
MTKAVILKLSEQAMQMTVADDSRVLLRMLGRAEVEGESARFWDLLNECLQPKA